MGRVDFDPYHKWLGIPKSEPRPPNYYRLLGIGQFENDIEVISTAADRQIFHVKKYSTGEHGDLAEQLINELTTARLTLINAQKKAAYDVALRPRSIGNTSLPTHGDYPAPLPFSSHSSPRIEVTDLILGTKKPKQSNLAVWYLVGSCIVTLILLAVLVKSQDSANKSSPVANSSSNPKASIQPKEKSKSIENETLPSDINPKEASNPVPLKNHTVDVAIRSGELFDHKSTEGWVQAENAKGKWEVVNGKLMCNGPRAVLFTESKNYTHFKLALKVRVTRGEATINILAHDVSPNSDEYGVSFCLGESKAFTGRVISRSDRKTMLPDVNVDVIDRWVDVEILSLPLTCTMKIDGKTVNSISRSQKWLERGAISLVQYSSYAEVEIDTIEITPLDAQVASVEKEPSIELEKSPLPLLVNPAKTEETESYDPKKIQASIEKIKTEYRRAVESKHQQMVAAFQVQFDLIQSDASMIPEIKSSILKELQEEWQKCKNFRTELPKSDYMKNSLNHYLSEEKIIRLKYEEEFYTLLTRSHDNRDKPTEQFILNQQRNLFTLSPTLVPRRTWFGRCGKIYFVSEKHWAEITPDGSVNLYDEISRNESEIVILDKSRAKEGVYLMLTAENVKIKQGDANSKFVLHCNGEWQIY
jgi:hypothetical protein